jgi:hypothetical protein
MGVIVQNDIAKIGKIKHNNQFSNLLFKRRENYTRIGELFEYLFEK